SRGRPISRPVWFVQEGGTLSLLPVMAERPVVPERVENARHHPRRGRREVAWRSDALTDEVAKYYSSNYIPSRRHFHCTSTMAEDFPNAVLRVDVSRRRPYCRCAGTVWDRRHRWPDRLGPVSRRRRVDYRPHDQRPAGATLTASLSSPPS